MAFRWAGSSSVLACPAAGVEHAASDLVGNVVDRLLGPGDVHYMRSICPGNSARDQTVMSGAGPSENICWPGRAIKAVFIPAQAAPATSQP